MSDLPSKLSADWSMFPNADDEYTLAERKAINAQAG
jgi:hypothetical protein